MRCGTFRKAKPYKRREGDLLGLETATDAQLLDRFVTSHETAAFESLVRRHGPMVLRVCQRVLNSAQDAEDAFQATFIVLMRKAGAITNRASLGSWLYGVAYRIALKARSQAAVRHVRELGTNLSALKNCQRKPEAESDWHELRPVLDEELNRLPKKYRGAVILCFLEGKTNDEAAQELGCSRGV